MTTEEGALFEELISGAQRQEFSGGDFSTINARWRDSPLSWDYRQKVLGHLGQAESPLDMGTGGGEFLSSLGHASARRLRDRGVSTQRPFARARLES